MPGSERKEGFGSLRSGAGANAPASCHGNRAPDPCRPPKHGYTRFRRRHQRRFRLCVRAKPGDNQLFRDKELDGGIYRGAVPRIEGHELNRRRSGAVSRFYLFGVSRLMGVDRDRLANSASG